MIKNSTKYAPAASESLGLPVYLPEQSGSSFADNLSAASYDVSLWFGFMREVV